MNYNNNNKLVVLSLSLLKGIGPAFIKKALFAKTLSPDDSIKNLKEITSIYNKQFDDKAIFEATELAKEIIFNCKLEGISIIDLSDKNYPSRLKEIKDPPPILYCKGNLELLQGKIVCIIGTREPNENGAKISERIGLYFSNNDWVIANGLAEGIDSNSVLNKDGIRNKVIGVLAGGLNYNLKKTVLNKTAINAEKTLKNGGLLISELPPNKKEDTFTVVKSCRIQAGIADGLILVQSSLDGGSRFTAKSFCETRRPIAVINPVPSDIDLESYGANMDIIKNGKIGLSRFTELKENKINTSKIFVMKSRDYYQDFEEIMNNKSRIEKDNENNTLFD